MECLALVLDSGAGGTSGAGTRGGGTQTWCGRIRGHAFATWRYDVCRRLDLRWRRAFLYTAAPALLRARTHQRRWRIRTLPLLSVQL